MALVGLPLTLPTVRRHIAYHEPSLSGPTAYLGDWVPKLSHEDSPCP